MRGDSPGRPTRLLKLVLEHTLHPRFHTPLTWLPLLGRPSCSGLICRICGSRRSRIGADQRRIDRFTTVRLICRNAFDLLVTDLGPVRKMTRLTLSTLHRSQVFVWVGTAAVVDSLGDMDGGQGRRGCRIENKRLGGICPIGQTAGGFLWRFSASSLYHLRYLTSMLGVGQGITVVAVDYPS